ncbi:LuxR family transcriptional regulator [Streptomyces sp. NPDC046805]|uniref:helix-turn-helix transcriptional regulator n=1 Tax=Streptomyces sp. NPDC046805 TaxID=3155134 RepID=UPI0033F9896D
MKLIGRLDEQAAVNRVLEDVRAGRGGALVLRGPAGIGKTALLDHAASSAEGLQVRRAAGVESESAFAYAGVQQLAAPFLDAKNLATLPHPQREALESVFGLRPAAPTGRILVGLALLTLLSNAAATVPLVCVVDDAQWLDPESAETLAFLARRARPEAIALFFAVRGPRAGAPTAPFDGLDELRLDGLAPDAARALLDGAAPGPVDAYARRRIVAEAAGNPLALLQITAELSADQLAGRRPLPQALPLGDRLARSLTGVVHGLPEATRLLLLTAAADPTGDEALVRRAGTALGADPDALGAAEERGLITLTGRLGFPHPLLRAALLADAPAQELRRVHRALADATDGAAAPDHRAWHRAAAEPGPDEEIAGELADAAVLAQRRGGLSTAEAFLRRAAELSTEPCRRAERLFSAAQAAMAAGALDSGAMLLERAEQELCTDPRQEGRAPLLRGLLALLRGRGSDAAPLLGAAARALEPRQPGRAQWAHLLVFQTYVHAGRYAPAQALADAARAASASPRSARPTVRELLLDGFAARFTDSPAAAAPLLRRAIEELPPEQTGPELEMALYAAVELWDDRASEVLSEQHLRLTRTLGGLVLMPLALSARGESELLAGHLAEAQVLYASVREIAQLTGNPGIIGTVPPGEVMVAALRGDENRARDVAESVVAHAVEHRLGGLADAAAHGLAMLHIAAGRYPEALGHLRFALDVPHSFVSTAALPDLVEAAARAAQPDLAESAALRLAESTRASGTPFALGIDARTRAVLAEAAGAEASEVEEAYAAAVGHLRETRAVVHLARAHLLYGEWLRRQRRRREARERLRIAHKLFDSIGAKGFARRASAELEATGEHVRREPSAADTLTSQEARVARLAAEGASNPEIADQLYVSRRTVEAHLTKIYAKLGVSSRTQLARHMPLGG